MNIFEYFAFKKTFVDYAAINPVLHDLFFMAKLRVIIWICFTLTSQMMWILGIL